MDNTTRHFEFKVDKSSKFWEITQAGESVTVRYGKTSTTGQSQGKTFADAAAADKHAQKLIAEKLGKGYVEKGAVASDAPAGAAPTTETLKTRKAASASGTKPARHVSPKQDPATVAKDLESTPEQLVKVVGINETVDRLLAMHPRASPQLLENLSHSSDKTVRNNVALNANTDKAVLLKLAPQFPGDFFKNPAFDWLLLEDPDLLTNLGRGVLKNILKLPDCPVSFMRWAAERGSEQERLAVVMNSETPTDVLSILALQTGEIGLAASGRAGISTDLAESATEIDVDETFTTALCRRLASIGDDDAVSAWSKALIGPGQWTHLSFTARMKTLGFSLVAILPKLLPEFAAVLAKDPNAEVRAFVALDSQTHEQVVQELANDIDPNVRAAALGRGVASATETTTFPEVLPDDWERILTKGNTAEKLALASHPLAPPHALEQISKKANATMFKALAFNPSCPAPVRLAACHSVADAAGPKILEGMAVDQKAPVQLRLRACERIWWGQFDKFVWSIKDSRRRKIHRTYGDLKNVFIKPQGEQLGQLHGRCCEKLLTDPAASLMAEFLEADQTAVEGFSSTMISAGCVSSLVAVRMLALMHRNAPPDDLAKAAKAVEWEVRLAVGRNTIAPRPVLIRLAGDADRRVTAQAKKTQKLQEEMVLAQNERIRSFTEPVDLTAIVQELIQRISKPRSDFDKSLFLPWFLVDSVWWDIAPFSNRLGTSRFVNPFHLPLPKLSESVLEKLAQHTDPGVRRFVARNPGASVNLLSRLADDKDTSVQYSTGMNPGSPENIQTKMAKKLAKEGISSSRRLGFRNLIEADPTLATEFLHVYARTVGGYRPSDIALNHGLSEADLKYLASPMQDERSLVARNPATPMAWLMKWATKLEETPEVAANPAVDIDTLLNWMNEPDEVLSELARNPALPVSAMRTLVSDSTVDLYVRKGLALNPALSIDLMEVLCKDKEFLVREALIDNPSTPWTMLVALWNDKTKYVNDAVTAIDIQERHLHHQLCEAMNPNTHIELLGLMAKNGPWVIRLAAAQNPAFEPSKSEAIISLIESEIELALANESASTQRDISTIGLTDLPSAMRALGLLQEREVAEQAEEASTSTDWLQRAAATFSDHVQPWVLRRLLDDEVDIVKQLAIDRLKKLESSKQAAGVAVP